ncbi:MAG: choloylglycine hydrolase family protein [Lachnospiraceae bacterium]|nr:choloylglycine hydrolase family protein [Lachnospiraceae bacterium]
MCTAINFTSKDHYFGRNLDLEYTYEESVTITPKNYPFKFRMMGEMAHHYAMIGMAYVVDGYPLYYDATNEKGVSMAGLRFAGNAHYPAPAEGKDNVPPFEFIPWILSQCSNLLEVKKLLDRVNLAAVPFSAELPLTPLHWMISYKEESLVVESMADGLHVYDNPVGVMTNNPPFQVQLWNLENTKILPGDLESPSRFVRAAHVLKNSVCGSSEEESVGQFFHILTSVEQQRGCNRTENGLYEITAYSSCCNADCGIYYYVTYGNRQITAVDMQRENLDSDRVISYTLVKSEQFFCQNNEKNA